MKWILALMLALAGTLTYAQTADWTYPPLRSPESVIRADMNAELAHIQGLFAGVASDLADRIDASLAGSTGLTLLGATTAGGARSTLGLGSAALQATSAFAAAVHGHTIADVTGLQAALDGKATAAQGALADSAVQPGDLAAVATSGSYLDLANVPLTFAPSAHTHSASAITDFAEAVDDRVSSLLVAGSGVALTYDDGAGTLTVAASPTVNLTLPAVTVPPSAPAAGNVTIFGENVANRMMLAMIGPSGIDTPLQPSLGGNYVAFFRPVGSTQTAIGLTYSPAGTATAANWAATNRYSRMQGIEYLVTTAATTAIAGLRSSSAASGFTVGGANAGDGGFYNVWRWGPATGVATTTSRAFAGMWQSSVPTDVEPSAQTNIVGMGWDAADTNIQMMHNDGAGTATKINLGASFPVPTVDRTSVYEIALFSPPGPVQSVGYRVTDLVSGAVASGVITTDLPANNVARHPHVYMSVGGTSSVVGVKIFSHYIETDY